MAKPSLLPPYDQLESDIIETLIEGHKQWRPDLEYPESFSDMQGAVRGLLQMFEVKRRKLPFTLPIRECTCGFVEADFSNAKVMVQHRNDDCPELRYLRRLARG